MGHLLTDHVRRTQLCGAPGLRHPVANCPACDVHAFALPPRAESRNLRNDASLQRAPPGSESLSRFDRSAVGHPLPEWRDPTIRKYHASGNRHLRVLALTAIGMGGGPCTDERDLSWSGEFVGS